MPEIPWPIILLGIAAVLVVVGCVMLQPKAPLAAKGFSILFLLGGAYMLISPKFNMLPGMFDYKIPTRSTLIVYLGIWITWGVGVVLHKSIAGRVLGTIILVIGIAAGLVIVGNPSLSDPGQMLAQVLDGVTNIIEEIMRSAAERWGS